MQIVRVDLRQRVVHELAPVRGRTLNEREVARQEEHGVQAPDQVHHALVRAVEAQHFFEARRRHAHVFQQQRDLKALQRAVARADFGGEAREGDGLLLGAPVDELPVAAAPGRARQGEVADGLQQAGLALGIGAVNEGGAGRQRPFEAGVVAEVGQRKMLDAHGLPKLPVCGDIGGDCSVAAMTLHRS